ncbi:uncharacterized protein EKO05_0009418 [Ascochyta rabiei]|uniref:uncharacterized protein n=1 Tax=Didymella rabiei TaxID=5454 RepID=UPI0021FCC20B|nr:uncharacterized protein EKO05_0009418 [Ascochyta rabiei]UPX19146.1 hypothetical protein EKO05_0009418 [Ascochyta rabiei]
MRPTFAISEDVISIQPSSSLLYLWPSSSLPVLIIGLVCISLVLCIRLKNRLLLHTSCRYKRRARVLAPQPNPGLEEGIAMGLCPIKRHLSLWLLVCGQEEGGCRTYVYKLLHIIQLPLCLVLRHVVRKADCGVPAVSG